MGILGHYRNKQVTLSSIGDIKVPWGSNGKINEQTIRNRKLEVIPNKNWHILVTQASNRIIKLTLGSS